MSSTLRAPLVKPTKSLYKGGLKETKGHQWTVKNETSFERVLELLCVVLLPISVGLLGASISDQDLTESSGDGQNANFGKLGYSQICFQGLDSTSGLALATDCAHVDTSCNFAFSPSTQAFMLANYNQVDSSLTGCGEYNAYRAFHVMAIILGGLSLVLMFIGYVNPSSSALFKRLRIWTFCICFAAGMSGVIAHCLFIDWWYTNQQNLITLAFLSEQSGDGSTPLYVTLAQSFFDLTGGWVCSLVAALFYVWTFTSATK